ncbi:MAG: hypothetical protein KGJ55_09545 [Gammaproteobacteria bacterium]|nr:hypothetical protein [Gammaproteobacteria bacterium]
MFGTLLTTTVRLLLFRAGPQDFPYSGAPPLIWGCVAFGILSNAVVAHLVAPWPAALALGAVVIAALWLFTRVTLRLRGFDNRVQQTFNALVMTSSVLTLALWLPATKLMPVMQKILEKLSKNPHLLQQPEALPQMDGNLVLAMYLLLIWQFAVTANIFRHATDSRPLGGVMIALLCVISVLLFQLLSGPLIQLFGG